MYKQTNTRILVSDFDYEQPETLDEAYSLLSEHGKEAQLIAGGTDVLVQMKIEKISPSVLVSLARIEELKGISGSKDLNIGATTTIKELSRNEVVGQSFEALKEGCNSFSTVPVMTMGTVGGNLCNASPAADTVPSLISFGAQVKLLSSSGERIIDLEEFLVGPGQSALVEGEVLHSVLLPAPAANTGSAFIKVARVVADISQVSVAVKIVRDGDKVADCRIALGSVGPTTVRALAAEQFLIGKKLDSATLQEAVRIVEGEITPITDVRTTEEYRRQVAGGITAEALNKSWERAQGGAI